MKTYVHWRWYLAEFFLKRELFQTKLSQIWKVLLPSISFPVCHLSTYYSALQSLGQWHHHKINHQPHKMLQAIRRTLSLSGYFFGFDDLTPFSVKMQSDFWGHFLLDNDAPYVEENMVNKICIKVTETTAKKQERNKGTWSEMTWNVRFEALTTANIYIAVFRVMTPCCALVGQ